jgi:hypothetical protein
VPSDPMNASTRQTFASKQCAEETVAMRFPCVCSWLSPPHSLQGRKRRSKFNELMEYRLVIQWPHSLLSLRYQLDQRPPGDSWSTRRLLLSTRSEIQSMLIIFTLQTYSIQRTKHSNLHLFASARSSIGKRKSLKRPK